jgi:hypothetical protein
VATVAAGAAERLAELLERLELELELELDDDCARAAVAEMSTRAKAETEIREQRRALRLVQV